MGQNTEEEERVTNFDSARIPETIPFQEMEINHATNEVRCTVNCLGCAQRVIVPFQRIVLCPKCSLVFKLSMV